jgi:hypothetical protein
VTWDWMTFSALGLVTVWFGLLIYGQWWGRRRKD